MLPELSIRSIVAAVAILAVLVAAVAVALRVSRSLVERIALLPMCLAVQIMLVAQGLSALGQFRTDWLIGAHVAIALSILIVLRVFRPSGGAAPADARNPRRSSTQTSFPARGAPVPAIRLSRRRAVFDRAQRPRLTSHCFTPAAWIVVAVAMCLALGIALRLESPTNFDTHTYRLPRVAFWLEAGAVSEINTNNARMNLMPYGDALLIGWSYALTGVDRYVHLVSWLFAIGVLSITYTLAREAGLCRRTAPLALVFLCGFSGFMVQAGGTQSDMLAAYFAAAGVFGAVRWLRTRQRRWLAAGSIGLGLGIATKQTVILALPAIAMILLVVALCRNSRTAPRRMLALAVGGLLGVSVFGAWSYFNNYRWYGHPFGPRETRVSESASERTFHGFRWRLKRELFMQLSPIAAPPWAAPVLSGIRDLLFSSSATGWWISRAFRYEWEELLNHGGVLNHDVVSFGTIPALFYAAALALSWPRRHTPAQWLVTVLLWSGLVFLVTLAATIDFMTTNGRFLLVIAPLGAIGVLGVVRRLRPPRVRTYAYAVLLVTGTGGAVCALCYHVQQPLFGYAGGPLLEYGEELVVAPGDTVGLLPGADGPIWSYLSPHTDRRFVSLADADYPVGELAVAALMMRHGLTSLVADVAEQHTAAIPGRLAGLHTWAAHVPGKGMQRIYVSRRPPAAALVKAGPGIRVYGELWFELDSPPIHPLRWSCDPVRIPALLEFDPAGGSCSFALISAAAIPAILEVALADAQRYALRVGVNHSYEADKNPGAGGVVRMAIHLAGGENHIRVGLYPCEWPDTTPVAVEPGPSLVRIRVWPLAAPE